jgi:hypothetical protein
MWQRHSTRPDSRTEHWTLHEADGRALNLGDVFALWRDSGEFRDFWARRLAQVEFATYCWECPPVTSSTLSRPFECVFVASPALAGMRADPQPFAAHFRRDRQAVDFDSLGKDARLVAPCPGGAGSDFAHLAAFVATADAAQASALWQTVGHALAGRVQERDLWLSTAGLGVAWLHVRLDSRPKYYRHAPYQRPVAQR